MKTRKEMVIPTNSDVTMTLQLAEVTITTNRGTRKADDELCITLTSINRSYLSAFLTCKQVDDLIERLQILQKDMKRK